jgi:hypothetical protein
VLGGFCGTGKGQTSTTIKALFDKERKEQNLPKHEIGKLFAETSMGRIKTATYNRRLLAESLQGVLETLRGQKVGDINV